MTVGFNTCFGATRRSNRDVASAIISHEQNQSNPVCCFQTLDVVHTRSVPKVRGLPSKLSFLLSDFHDIPQNVTLMSKFFGIFYKAE